MTNIVARPIHKKTDFPIMCQWWDMRKFHGADVKYTPERGIMVMYKGVAAAGAFIIETNADLAILDIISSDPELDHNTRGKVLDVLIEECKNLARSLGYSMITAAATKPRLMARYEKHGFFKADENVTHFGGLLCPGFL